MRKRFFIREEARIIQSLWKQISSNTFAVRYLQAGGDPFSLQELLGHEDMATVKLYMHLNDQLIQEQKRKYSPGDHLPKRMPGTHESRRQRRRRRPFIFKKEQPPFLCLS